MRRLILISIIASLLGVLFFVEHRDTGGRVGLGAVMRLIADFEHEAERVPLTVTRVSDAEEIDIGNRIASNHDLSPDNYLERIGQRLSSHVQRKGISYHFYLEDSPTLVDAFALPGGHVVVARGLLNLMQSEDELAALLGHEIAHVDRRHCVERLQYELAARKLGLSLPYEIASLPIAVFHAGYNKELELEADRVGIGFAVAEGYSADGAIHLFSRFQEMFGNTQARAPTPAKEISGIVLGSLGEYLRSHPPAPERISEIEKEIIAHHWKRTAVRPLERDSVGK